MPDTAVTVALLRATPGKRDELFEAIRETVTRSRAEEYCEGLDAHYDLENPDLIVLVERWRSREDFTAHWEKPYMKRLPELTHGLQAERPTVHILAPVEHAGTTPGEPTVAAHG